ncbi:NBS-LRR type disease resistance protein [Medicago truncatula]|uniref:NBS-LRR type disease resistance protein n=1 Tax=Medicago truncatula TaxID=3880 RepID=A0A072TL54_MEDTR|nr:NBS-LRR type disease resistance protein [Medicago truncatula]
MEILISIVGKIAEYTVVPIGRQASYLIFYKGNFKTLNNHVGDLEAARERMIHSVKSERENGKEIEKDVLNWLEKVDGVIKEANQLQNDSHNANVRCSPWSFPNLILRHQLSRNATKIANNVVEVQGKEKFNSFGHLPPLDVVASSSSTRDGEMYDTRESLKKDIVKALGDSTSCNIGIYGLGGVGKTTLVEKVAQIAKEYKLFDKVVKAEVSKKPDIRRIQGEIADFLGLRFEEESILGRAERLRQRIKMERSVLIILDNIWTILDLKEVGIPVGYEHNGCKLLMTSRNQDVLLQMDVPKDFTFKVELMTENESWSLFQVVTVARAMKNKRDVQSWKDALRKLQSNDHTEMDSGTYSALELSYNSLESDEMRALFLLFALLAGDIEYFLKVAMGLDILKHVNAIDDARNRLYTIIKSLEAACLLLEVKTDGNIQMHDFVRDFAISIACRDKLVLLRKQSDAEWPTNDFLKRCRQIVLDRWHMDELPQTIFCPNIKFFVFSNVNRSLEIPDTFFEGMRCLRVVDLTGLNLLSLPTSFRLLTDLQTLCLYRCVLENMDALEALQNLEILCLWKSSMIKLPREIGRLIRLRMLDLSHSGIEVVPPNIISSLTKLEELYMGNTSINWEDVSSTVHNENASLAELRKLPKLTALELQIRETWMLPRDLQLVFEKLERYKIAIGDVWDWSDIKDGTLKTLMLKLGTNIHLEHGIKALIKGVENLYLDDVDGIQNVLPNLNREGFTLLKHLHVQNNTNLNHIVDNKERNQIHASFPILETLVLLNLRNLEHICHGQPSVASFGSLSVIKVKNCVQLKYLFSFTMVKGLSHLCKIEVCECNSMKEIVFRDNNSSANNDITDEKIEFLQLRSLTLEHLETLDNFFSYYLTHSRNKQKCHGLEPCDSAPFFNAQVAFPNLDTLKLSSLLNLNKVWDDNHQSMCNLTSLIVDNCVGLKYLFPSTLVESFMNLKHLEISNCHMMEEIIAKKDRNNALKEVRLLNLEKIILKDMNNLKTIWHRQFETSKMLEVNNCKKIVVVFPSSMQNTYNELEKLEVRNCALVEEIFELTFNKNNSVEVTTHLKEVTIDGLLKLKKIWSGDPEGILSFRNLINVQLVSCRSLEYLLPLSVATRCSHLKELGIKWCENIKEIVAEEKESSLSAAPIFEFNQLSTLLLWNLPKLNGFYAGNHTLACPSLRKINVSRCTKLKLFRTLSTRSSNFRDDKPSVLTQPPLFIAEEVIPNLELLRMVQADADMILQTQNSSALFSKMTSIGLTSYNTEEAIFPYWFLENVHTLELLLVEWSCFKKIFQDKGEISEKTLTQIKTLMLNELPKLQYICDEGSQIDPVLEFLEYLMVRSCSSLTNLMPSSVTLNHLTQLEIIKCNGLKYLFTTPTAQSLDKLTVLQIEDCSSLEEIITGVENVDIAFVSLQILNLECLPSLVKFCSSECFMKFPSLEKVIVGECPRMKIFSAGHTSTPILQKVKIAENDSEWHWKGNLNNTIYNMFEDKVGFVSFKHLQLSEYPELKELWYGQHEHNTFRSLKYLVVHKCDFLSDVLFQPNLLEVLMNLEELDVEDCNSLEAVFDLKDEFAKEIVVRNSTQLKKLKISNLPKLKHVWKEDAFPSLDTLKLSSLLNLNKVWDDNHQSMCNLTSLIVDNCVGLKYLFPSTLVKSFMNLKHLEISNCPMMEEIIAKKERNNALKEVHLLKLEKIILKDMDNLKSIWHHQFETLKMLEVNNCKKIVVVFPSSMQNTYNELEKLEVTNCALVEEIFELNFNENNSEEVMTQLKEVTIDGLFKLKKIWSGDPQGILSFQNLIYVLLDGCTSLEYLLPLSVATRCSHLKELGIKWCENMKEIVAEEKESSLSAAPIFEFNQLSTLLLWHSPKLNGFYAGNHTLLCPSLRNIGVSRCTKLKLFRTLSNFQDDKHSVSTKQPLFIAEQVIPNLEMLRMQQTDADVILQSQNSSALLSKMTILGLACYNTEEATFPYWFLENVHTLEKLHVEWSCFKKIFQDKGEISEKTHTQIKTLMLNELPKLQHICDEGSQIDPVLEFLEYLRVRSCSSLTNLMPSSVTLNHLTQLEIIKCNGLKYLFTTPTARSLDKLTVLKIKDCNSLEEVVNGVENVDIAFISLQILMLECLPSLIKFCSSKCFMKFPLLEKVIVRECSRMKIFSAGDTSTPILQKVKIAENDSEWHWKGNLNDTIYNMFEDKAITSVEVIQTRRKYRRWKAKK